MERDEHILGMIEPDKNVFDRSQVNGVQTNGMVDKKRPAPEKLKENESFSAYLALMLRAHVLNSTIERLEKRNLTDQVLDRRVENISRLVASYATDLNLERFRQVDETAPSSEADLINQLLSLTGSLRGGFKVLERSAQLLGDSWEADSRNFLEVTIGMTRLQLLMRKLVEQSPQGRKQTCHGKALIAVATGEEHTFGQCMLEEVLRAQGWQTGLFNPKQTSGLAQYIKREGPQLVCFSWISSCLETSVAEELDAVREIPLYKRPIIVAGGQAALKKDKWIVSHGVDQICDSAYAATEIATKITETIEKNAQTVGRHVPFEDVGGLG
ncbi:MAG: cobalamin B12-binding domain-containing protein [Pseudomonadota bacterium]